MIEMSEKPTIHRLRPPDEFWPVEIACGRPISQVGFVTGFAAEVTCQECRVAMAIASGSRGRPKRVGEPPSSLDVMAAKWFAPAPGMRSWDADLGEWVRFVGAPHESGLPECVRDRGDGDAGDFTTDLATRWVRSAPAAFDTNDGPTAGGMLTQLRVKSRDPRLACVPHRGGFRVITSTRFDGDHWPWGEEALAMVLAMKAMAGHAFEL